MNYYENPSEAVASVQRSKPKAEMFAPLDREVREVVPTDCAAWHLNRKPQTLRCWACTEAGPIRPVRISGRLGWRTEDIKRLVSGGAK